jgi:UDP-glucose 4-epimerase
MRKILVTGGAGNVGGSLARRLAANPNNYVVIVDDLTTGNRDKLPRTSGDNWRFVRADANRKEDMSPIFTAERFDAVFHYAAVVGVQRTLANPKLVLNDIHGFETVLDLAKNTGVKRVFFSSSSEVYGEPFEIPQREDTTPLNSRLPYAVVKNVGESYFRTYTQEFGLPHTIFRFFNTYGPLQSTDFVMSKFLTAAQAGKDITLYGDGLQTRTFCYVDDNLDFTEKLLEEDLGLNDTINVGNAEELTIRELAETVIRLTGSSSKIVHLPPLAEGDMTRRCPDVSKMLDILGRPLVTLEEGIRKMMAAERDGVV